MNKRIFSGLAALLIGSSAYAATVNEWTFEYDVAGLTLSQTTNNGPDKAFFSAGGTGQVETDGEGSLLCTNNVVGTNGMWTSGTILTANVSNATSPDIRYLRFDLDYDLDDSGNDSGTLLALSFSDNTGTNIAGLALQYEVVTNATPGGVQLTSLTNGLPLTGSITAIAKVDLSGPTLDAWYDFNNSGLVYAASNVAINITSIDQLKFQATGDFTPTGSDDGVAIDNIRTADDWTSITNDLIVVTALPDNALPGDIVKMENNDALNQTSSWVDGALPGTANRAVYAGTSDIITAPGAALNWKGIGLLGNTGSWTISNDGNSIALGTSGINMSSAEADLSIESELDLTASQTWSVTNSRTLSVSGTLSGASNETLTKTGTGTLSLSGANTFAGGVIVSNGVLSIGNDNALGAGPLSIGTASLETTSAVEFDNDIELFGNTVFDNANQLTVNGVISGAGSLTKTNSGLLVLNGANTYSGGTTNYGTIEIGNINALGSGQTVMGNSSVLQLAPLLIGGGSTSPGNGVSSSFYLDGNTIIQTEGRNSTIDEVAIDGDISGPGALTLYSWQVGLFGNNTFSGGLTLDFSGWLYFTDGALGSGTITTLRNTLLRPVDDVTISNVIQIDNLIRLFGQTVGSTIEFAGPISGSGTLRQQDNRDVTWIFSADNSGHTGVTDWRGGRLQLENPNAIGPGQLQIINNSTFVLAAAETNVVISGDIRLQPTSTGGQLRPLNIDLASDLEIAGDLFTLDTYLDTTEIQKTGSGALIFSGTLSHPGALSILSGPLVVNGSIVSSLITMAGGAELQGSAVDVPNTVLQAGSSLNLANGIGFSGDLTTETDSLVKIALPGGGNQQLSGNGSNTLRLGGTLELDFTGNISVPTGTVFNVLNNWGTRTDAGVTLTIRNLPANRQLDTSNLFIDGTVSVLEKIIVPVTPEPGDIFKADNSDNLNLGSSWTGGIAPNENNRAVFHSEILLPLTTSMGTNLYWGGIALISNAVSWTISNDGYLLTLGSGGIDMSNAMGDFVIEPDLFLAANQTWDVGPLRQLSVFGEISGNGSLTKDGEGTLAITSTTPNTSYSGAVMLNEGILLIANTDVLGTGDVYLNGGSLFAPDIAELSNDITLSNAPTINTINELTLNGTISGSGSLVKSGAGTLTLTESNTYSGGTTNNQGIIYIHDANALGTGKLTLNDNTALQALEGIFGNGRSLNNDIEVNGDTAIISDELSMFIDSNISGPGSLALSGNTFYLHGNNSFSGGFLPMTSGFIFFNDDNSLGSGPVTIEVGSTGRLRAENTVTLTNSFVLNNTLVYRADSGTTTFAGPLSGSGTFNLTQNAPGTLMFPRANPDFSGTVDLHGHRLVLGNGLALGTGNIDIQPNSNLRIGVSEDLTGANSLPNTVTVNNAFFILNSNEVRPLILNLDHDLEFSGTFTGHPAIGFKIQKNGSGALVFSGAGSSIYDLNLNAGSLRVANSVEFRNLYMASGTTLDIETTPVFTGDLNIDQGAQVKVAMNDDNSGLIGQGGDLLISGTLFLDFENYSGANSPINIGDTFEVLSGWSTVTDNGLDKVIAANLPPFMAIDASNLIDDGTVTIVGSRLSAQTLTITVPSGMTTSEDLILTNTTGASLEFTLKNNGSWPAGNYTVSTESSPPQLFIPSQSGTVFADADWNNDKTIAKPIGFDFGVFGADYTTFSVSQKGTIILSGGGKTVTLKPYETSASYDPSTVRYMRSDTKLVVAWGVNPGTYNSGVLQASLNADGTIHYNYKVDSTLWSGGKIAVGSQTINYTPGTSSRDLVLTPSSWISNTPTEGTISSGGTRSVTFTANAANQEAGESLFSTPVYWSDGQVSSLTIQLIVIENAPNLEVPNPFTFSGSVLTKTMMTITNTGDANLTYTLTDSGLQSGGYTVNEADYNWSSIANYTLSQASLGAEAIGIGFPFTYFGNTYSTLIVNEDGSLTLASGSSIIPFSAGLDYDSGTSEVSIFRDAGFEKLTVTWKNMSPGNQTFQAVLNRDGNIKFNYKTLAEDWLNGTILITDPAGTVTGSLINDETMSVESTRIPHTVTTTNWDYGVPDVTTTTTYTTNITTNYVSTIDRQAIAFTPGVSQVISASPSVGTVAAGGTANVTIIGDARNLGTGTYSTTLTFSYDDTSTNSLVNFTATTDTVDSSMFFGSDASVTTRRLDDGSYKLSWSVPSDWASRTYRIYYTTSLTSGWTLLDTVVNAFSYIDTLNKDEPVIFYKVTGE